MLDTAASSAAASTETASSSSSSPTDTESIARSVISDVESGNSDGDSQSASVEPQQQPAPKQQNDPPPADDDFDAVEAETTDSLGRKRVNAIPHPRVKKMIEKREKAVIAKVAKELGITKAEAELQLDDVLGGLTERNTKFTEYEQRIQVSEAVEAIMEQDGDRFVRMLAQANPERYNKFLKVLDAVEEPRQEPQREDDPEPEPDYDLGDGRKTYSLDGMKRRDEWKERQLTKKIMAQMDDRLSPYEQERKQREQREKAKQAHDKVVQTVDRAIERAMQWPGFSDNQEAIAKLIDSDPKLDLVDAYMQVVVKGKLSTDRTKMRQELLDEINATPSATSATTASAVAPQKDSKSKTTADIAREEIARLAA